MMLVTTIDQVRDVIGSAIRQEGSLEILNPYLKKTEEKLIADLIGQQQVTALYTASTGSLARLKSLALSAIIWNAYQEAWHQAFYQMGSTGVNRLVPKNTETLFRYQEDAIKEDIIRKADESIEDLMLFLESNIDSFPLYKDSPEYAKNFAFLISTPGTLQRSLPEVSKSFRMYMVLRGFMDRAENMTVRGVLGEDLYTDLKSKISSAEALNTHYKKLLNLSQDLAAPTTLLEAMPWITVQFSPSGIRIMKVFNNLKDETPLSDVQTQWLMDNLRTRMKDAKSALRVYLNSTASSTVFPEYFNSPLYQAPGSKQWVMPNNEGKKHFRL